MLRKVVVHTHLNKAIIYTNKPNKHKTHTAARASIFAEN